MARQFTRGSGWGWTGEIAFPAAVRVLDVDLAADLDRIEPALITVALESIRRSDDPAAPASETEAEAMVEWGSFQGAPHQAVLDIGRGLTFGVTASQLRVTVRNIGVGADGSPSARWRASASLGGTSRLEPPIRAVRVGVLDPGGASAPALVPAFASHVRYARSPQQEALVQFTTGDGVAYGDYRIAAGTDGRVLVPPGADRFSVVNLGALPMRGRVLFELSL